MRGAERRCPRLPARPPSPGQRAPPGQGGGRRPPRSFSAARPAGQLGAPRGLSPFRAILVVNFKHCLRERRRRGGAARGGEPALSLRNRRRSARTGRTGSGWAEGTAPPCRHLRPRRAAHRALPALSAFPRRTLAARPRQRGCGEGMGLSPAGARHGQGGLGEVPALPALRPQPPLLGESEQVATAARVTAPVLPLHQGLREPGRGSGPLGVSDAHPWPGGAHHEMPQRKAFGNLL